MSSTSSPGGLQTSRIDFAQTDASCLGVLHGERRDADLIVGVAREQEDGAFRRAHLLDELLVGSRIQRRGGLQVMDAFRHLGRHALEIRAVGIGAGAERDDLGLDSRRDRPPWRLPRNR